MFTFFKDHLRKQDKENYMTALWLSAAKNINHLAVCRGSLPDPCFRVLLGCKAESEQMVRSTEF